METQFWRNFAIGFLAVNTLCAVILFEVLMYDVPYVSAFIILFFGLFLFNKRLFLRHK